MSLRGVLFTDTGPYRGAMRQCYHRFHCKELTMIMIGECMVNADDVDDQGVRLEEKEVQGFLRQL